MKIEAATTLHFQKALTLPGTPIKLVVQAQQREGADRIVGVLLEQEGPLIFRLTDTPVILRLLASTQYIMGGQEDLYLPLIIYLDGMIDVGGQGVNVQQIVFVASYLTIREAPIA